MRVTPREIGVKIGGCPIISRYCSPMGKTLTNSAKLYRIGSDVPAPVRFGVGIGIPSVIAAYVLWQQLHSLPPEAWTIQVNPLLLVLVVALMPFNWGLETLKWAELMPFGKMSHRVREVLYGTAWSLIGPLRIGAAIGRVSTVQAKNRAFAVRAFAVSSVSQWWCTVFACAVGLLVMEHYVLAMAAFAVSTLALSIYFNGSPKLRSWLKRTEFIQSWLMSGRIALVRRKRALKLSVARFIVMLSQFLLALNAFGHLTTRDFLERWMDQLSGISMTWGLTSLAPVPMLGDLGLREAAALLALPAPTASDLTAIVCATLSLWVVNLIIPAIVGLAWQSCAMRTKKQRTNLPA